MERAHKLHAFATRLADTFPLHQRSRYWLYQERGINCHVEGDYANALDYFLAARTVADEPWLTFQSSMNTLLCFESLGIPYVSIYKETRGAAESVRESSTNWPNVEEALRQLDCFDRRRAFLSGDIETVFAPSRQGSAMLEEYFTAWVALLPYPNGHLSQALRNERTESVATASSFHLADYRRRTLLGVMHPDDSSAPKPMDIVARIYLWTWRWLSDPCAFSVDKIIATIRYLDCEREIHRFAVEDLWLLKLSFLWLGLFEPRSDLKLRAGRIKPQSSKGFELCHFEQLVVEYFLSLRSGCASESEDLLILLRAHPLWKSDVLSFRPLVEAVRRRVHSGNEPPDSTGVLHLMNLANAVNSMLASRKVPGANKIEIDLQSHCIAAADERIISEPMCRAFALLREKANVSCGEFLQGVFGLNNYDAVIHDARILNLLARMRRLLQCYVGERLQVGVKRGQVFARGQWDEIIQTGENAMTKDLALALARRSINLSLEAVSPAPKPVRATKPMHRAGASALQSACAQVVASLGARGQMPFRRSDIEILLGVSRAGANRILDKMSCDAIVKAQGKGPQCSYMFLNSHEEGTKT